MFDLANLTLAATLGLAVLALAAGLAWAHFQARADRLPAATRHADIRERLALAQAELRRAEEAKRDLDRQIHDRDRLVAEVAQMQTRVEELRLELENLAPAREEIDEVKRRAAEAAQQKAELEAELKTLRVDADRLRAELDPERVNELRRSKEGAEHELTRLRDDLDRLRPERDTALRDLAEAREAEVRVAVLMQRIDELKAEAEPLATEITRAREQLQTARQGAEVAREEQDKVERNRTKLEAEIASLTALRDGLALELESKSKGSGMRLDQDREALISDLVASPACLAAPPVLRGVGRTEIEALHTVTTHLKDSGLRFARRTLLAFHTAIKVNDSAQLTVLAGVSGTGKSLLPRRYAEAMGMHFLQVAVEPRWDSPQDLLGFYNYVEGKYRATELARLMAHLDPWRALVGPEDRPDREDRMALVLLDEMNLARVEYYFSEFLSRLEARPAWREGLSQTECKDALISVDVRGLEDPPRLFPAHNILFVGTMNDDESTQSLTDKVLDRGNVLQFPAPADFSTLVPSGAVPAVEGQSFREWRSWVRAPGALAANEPNTLLQDTVGDLSRIMHSFGRPFGHRLNQAIRAYAVNYPLEKDAGVDLRVPLADQIEFRILPKLRGIEIDSHRKSFNELIELIRKRLDDHELADRLKVIYEEQGRGSNLFFWRGLTRND